jgi:hypothetical protein
MYSLMSQLSHVEIITPKPDESLQLFIEHDPERPEIVVTVP